MEPRKSFLLRLIEKDKGMYLSDMLKSDDHLVPNIKKKVKQYKKAKKLISTSKTESNDDKILQNNDIIWDGTILNTPTSTSNTSTSSKFSDLEDNNTENSEQIERNLNDKEEELPKNDEEDEASNNDKQLQRFALNNPQCSPRIKSSQYYMEFKEINQEEIDNKDKIKLINHSRMLATEIALASQDMNIIRNTKSESSSRTSRLNIKYGNITYNFSNGSHVDSCTCEKCRKRAKHVHSKNKRIANGNGSTSKEIYVGSNNDERIIIENNTMNNGTFKMVGNVKLVIDIFECHNFQRTKSSDFSILWSNHYIKGYSFKSLSRYQRVNLFPRSWECTRKDSMARNINAMAHLHGQKHFSFMPECYILPHDRDSLLSAFELSRGRPWIVKPAGSSQGRGIYITSNPLELPDTYHTSNDDNWIVGRYIDNPLLIDSRKFDLRLYVAVTSFNPLKIYLHEEGLCRLATEKYSNETYDQKYAHLTNYSINKHNVKICTDNEGQNDMKAGNNNRDLKGTELKLSFAELNSILEEMGICTAPIWSKIEDLIVKTLIAVESKIYNALDMFSVNNESCFELFGFDVLIDSALNPWLMEVNFAPSLNTDSPLDLKVKSKVLADLFNLVGVKQSGLAAVQKNESLFDNPFSDNSIDEIISDLKKFDIDLQGDKGKRALIIFIKEMQRASIGGYKLIFPVKVQQGQHISTILRYSTFFEKERPLNKLLAQYIFATSLLENQNKQKTTNELTSKKSLTASRLREHLVNSKDFNSLWSRAIGQGVR